MKPTNQREHRQSIAVDTNSLHDVTSVGRWYKAGHFENEEQARGAFKLAYQQAMDGMGKSIAQWMGLSETELNAWMRSGALPPK
jgi:hypothetical protein